MSDHGKIVTLEVISWAYALGGEHYTGSIIGYTSRKYRKDGSDYLRVEIKHRLTAGEAKKLNKKDGARGLSLHKPGEKSNRFETQRQLELEAAKQYKKHFPKALALNVGSFAVCNPERVIAGPRTFVTAANRLIKQQEKCGGYGHNPLEMERILRAYEKLVRALGSGKCA